MSAPIPGLSTPLPDLCKTCRYRGLSMGLNNETVTQESVYKFFCKAIPELVFSLAQPDENDIKNIQQNIDTLNITEPEGNILDITTFITNCTEYERVTVIIILSVSYNRVTDEITVTYQVIGLTAGDTVGFNIDGVQYDTNAVATDGTYTQTTTHALVDGDYRVNVNLVTDGARSQFLPLRLWESVVLLAVTYEEGSSGLNNLIINYSQFYTDNSSDLEIWIDGVMFDTISPVVNGENQEYDTNTTLPNGTYDFYLVDTASGFESNHISLVVDIPLT